MRTHFLDMHSGGGQKENFSHCFIEAPESEAKIIFYNRFGHNPERVTCTCCGDDYSIREYETLEQATAFERNCKYQDKAYIEEKGDSYREYLTLPEYLKKSDVLIIFAAEHSAHLTAFGAGWRGRLGKWLVSLGNRIGQNGGK